MTRATSQEDGATRLQWLLLIVSGLLALGAAAGLWWLLYHYVPLKVAVLADLQQPLPQVTRIVIATSTWFVRVLPFLILLGPPTAIVIGLVVVLYGIRRGERWFIGALATAAIVAGLVELVACGAVVYGMSVAYEQSPTH